VCFQPFGPCSCFRAGTPRGVDVRRSTVSSSCGLLHFVAPPWTEPPPQRLARSRHPFARVACAWRGWGLSPFAIHFDRSSSDAPVAPRKALRSCPTSLTACPCSRRDVFRRLETASLALFRSLTSPVAPRAPRERSLAPAWLRHTHPKVMVRVHSIHLGASRQPLFRRTGGLAPRRLPSCIRPMRARRMVHVQRSPGQGFTRDLRTLFTPMLRARSRQRARARASELARPRPRFLFREASERG
jgi:hypothetical protein